MTTTIPANALLDTALGAISSGDGFHAVLNAMPVPVYLADADGAVTYWNQACVDFAGRVPQLGQDRWCVTWKIFTTSGDYLPHDRCPMAEAIRERRVIRGKLAIAMRPDGSRRAFIPYPTPLFDNAGHFTGAVNMQVDVTEEQAEVLADQARRCRRLAGFTHDREASEVLDQMAEDYEQAAASLQP